jgi:hypothetical protein
MKGILCRYGTVKTGLPPKVMPRMLGNISLLLGLLLLFSTPSLSQIPVSGQPIQPNTTLTNQDSTGFPYIYEVTVNYYKIDAGSWIGLRVGAQTEGGSAAEQWAVSGYYELRSPNSASMVLDYQVWQSRVVMTARSGNSSAMYGIISAALKFRYNYKRCSAGIQGGIGTGIWLTPFSVHYGLSAEYRFSNDMAVSISHKRYGWNDFGPFVFLGVSKKI